MIHDYVLGVSMHTITVPKAQDQPEPTRGTAISAKHHRMNDTGTLISIARKDVVKNMNTVSATPPSSIEMLRDIISPKKRVQR